MFRVPDEAIGFSYVELASHGDNNHVSGSDIVTGVGFFEQTNGFITLPQHLLIRLFQYLNSPIKAAGVYT